MYRLLALLISFLYLDTYAHPGIGIVRDSKGNIYYTDLQQVWKIDPKSLQKIVDVPNVHTHELYMDVHNNLYGQHSLYSGEQTNKWSHYVWKLNSNGSLDTVVPLTDGFYIENFSFAGDKSGNQYWIQHWKTDRLIRKTPNGNSEVLYEGDLKNVQWMFPINDKLYFVKEDDIYFVDEPGNLKLFAKDLAGKKEGGHNAVFGMWTDNKGNLFIANSDLKKVQKHDSSGNATDFYKSGEGWFPTAGLFDDNGDLWLMEWSVTNKVRVQKISQSNLKNASKQEAKKGSINYIFVVATGIIITAAIVLNRKRRK